jgi:hypothetical protein
MRDLERIQRWMQAVITHQGGVDSGVASAEARRLIDVAPADVEQVVTRSQALTALDRLEIYNRAYFARLVECLREEYPVLLHALGDEAFDSFAVGYLQEHPSRSYTLNDLGTKFPSYLEESRPTSLRVDPGGAAGPSWPDFLIDLAWLELTYNEVFDGPGVEGQPLLEVERVRSVPPERWPDARLVPVPCLRLLALRHPVHKYFRAVRRKKQPAIPQPAETFLAVTRREYVVRRYELSRLQYVLLAALTAGHSVGQAIDKTASAAGPDLDRLAVHLHAWFRDWTAEGFFQAIE